MLEGAGRGLEEAPALRGAGNIACTKHKSDAGAMGDGNKENKGKYLKELKELSFKEVTRPTRKVKCLYTNTCSLGNKQEELMLLENHDTIVTKTWWHDFHDWSVAINGYRRPRQERRGGDVSVYIRKGIECKELSLKSNHKQVNSLEQTIRDQGSKGSLVISVYYRPPDQPEPANEAFYLQL